jgi:hypothetical protein
MRGRSFEERAITHLEGRRRVRAAVSVEDITVIPPRYKALGIRFAK